jgi:hypothetical protein
MRLTAIVGVSLFCGATSTAYACTLPKLLIVPPADQVAGREAEIRAAANTYFTEMQAYTACVQEALAAAGGDAAPDLVKRVYVARNNTAVAEAEFMMKLFTDNVGAASPTGPPSPAAPEAESRGRRDR